MIRFITLTITAIALVFTVILSFLTYSVSNEIDKLETGINDAQILNASYYNDVLSISNDIDQKRVEKNDLDKKLSKVRKDELYKTQPTAFLTFDDGPSAKTNLILDILKEYDIKATFFIIGMQAEKSGADTIIKRIVEEGHTIGCHSYSHKYEDIYKSVDAFFADFDKANNIIEAAAGFKPHLFRFPSGTATALDFCRKYGGNRSVYDDIVAELDKRGFIVNDWNIDTLDYSPKTGVRNIIDNAVEGAQKRLGTSYVYKSALILMHDGSDTVAALPDIIKNLKLMGYNFESLNEDSYSYKQIQ